MSRPIFTPKKEGPSLTKIVIVLALLAAVAYGGLYGYQYYRSVRRAQTVQKAPDVIQQAQDFIDQGKYDEAKDNLTALLDKPGAATVAPRALRLLAEIARHAGDEDQALTYLHRAAYDYPNDAGRPAAAVAYGKQLEKMGRDDDARKVYKDVTASAPPDLRAPALTGLGRLQEKEGHLEAARDLYKKAVQLAPWDSQAWNDALDALGAANVKLIFSTKPTEDSDYYTVEPGDNLIGIGIKLNTTQGLLTRANGLKENSTLHVGQRLKYTHKDFRIVIERSTCRLFLFDGSGLFKRYYVGLGKKGHETTLGKYRIGNKQKNPAWYKPGVGRIPFGDPRNELGTRWMPMVPEAEDLPRDLGIHGTFQPDSVGKYSSSGCARLINDKVEELYDLVVRATPVEVVDKIKPDDAS